MSATANRLEHLTVTVPMVPASCLLPNAQRRTYFKQWAKDAAELRIATAYIGRAIWLAGGQPGSTVYFRGPVRISAKIAWPKGRKTCDFQAAVHALKAAVDGLEDAGVLANDKQVIGMDIEQVRAARDDLAGYVEMTITGETA